MEFPSTDDFAEELHAERGLEGLALPDLMAFKSVSGRARTALHASYSAELREKLSENERVAEVCRFN